MSKIEKVLERIKSCLNDNGKVLVAVGDLGEEHEVKINHHFIIHCVYVSKHDRIRYTTNVLSASSDEVSNTLESIKQLVSPFYFISDISDANAREFKDLFTL